MELEAERSARHVNVYMIIEGKSGWDVPGAKTVQSMSLHFAPATEALEIVRDTYERHGVASKSARIQFKKHIASNHQPANQAVLQTKRRLGDINICSSLRDVRMSRPSRIRPAGGAGRISGAGAAPKTRIGLRDEFRAVKQTLTVNIKRAR
jgi:hypothetical protein